MPIWRISSCFVDPAFCSSGFSSFFLQAVLPEVGQAGDRYNLLVILGQFVSHLYQRVSAMYQES